MRRRSSGPCRWPDRESPGYNGSGGVQLSRTQLRCIAADCQTVYPANKPLYQCPKCGDLLDVVYELGKIDPEQLKRTFDARLASKRPIDQSGVWRYRELLPFFDDE